VLANSGASIVDASGNTWTIEAGVVLENGQSPAFSSNVTEIAWVGGVIYQGNAANQWYSWNPTTSAWVGGPNPFTSICTYLPSTGQITCTVQPAH
jgi:hypothetical protein